MQYSFSIAALPTHPKSARSAIRWIAGAVLLSTAAFAQISPARFGAPRLGSGPIDFRGYVRVIDGNTLEITRNGKRIGVGLIGIDVPQGNTPRGRLATQLLQTLVAGGVFLAEDTTLEFDSRKRRMYYGFARDNRKLASLLVDAGLARPNGQGKYQDELAAVLREATLAKRLCTALTASGPCGQFVTPTEAEDAEAKATNMRAAAVTAPSAGIASGFTQQVVAGGFSTPTAFAMLPDGRILVAEKRGVVRVIKTGVVLSTPLLDLSSRVNDYWDRGLIGIAVDPNFALNGYVYLAYTYENNAADYSGPKTARVSRFTAVGDVAALNTELTVLGSVVGSSCPPSADCLGSENPSHSVGQLRFDSSGNLFVTVGDGASFNLVDDLALRAQDVNSLSGKVLRISPTGAGLPTNPFYTGTALANASKVWASGVRNAFRFSIGPSGDPYAGDVGWDTWEEINAATRGSNLGWPCYEGQLQQAGYAGRSVCQTLYAQGATAVKPGTLTWSHFYAGQPAGSAAVGGVHYTGTAYPAPYREAYFYGDYAQNWIRWVQLGAGDTITSGPHDFLFGANGLTQLDQGSDGSLYFLSSGAGELRRIVYTAADVTAPTVTATQPTGTGIALTANITATLSELIDPNTVAGNFTLIQQSNGQPATGTAWYDGNAQTIRFALPSSTQLVAGTTYQVTARGGANGVRDLSGNSLAADRTWTFTTINPQRPPAGTTDLSAVAWTSTTNGWGPAELNNSNGEQAAGDGRLMRIRTQSFEKGIGVHAPSDIHYFAGNSCSNMQATVGVDNETAPNGSVVFQVFGDGIKLYESPVLTGNSAPLTINVPLTGVNDLSLVVTDADDGAAFDHADWAGARITCGTTSPTTTISNVAAGGLTGTSAVITWNTNNVADSQVEFGTTTAYGSSSPLTSALVLSHSVQLAGLSANTTYHYRARSRDFSGDLVTSPDATFTTLSASATTTYLSDINWTSMTNGWGPAEKDASNGEQAPGDGRQISIRGVKFTKGIGAHAPSDIRYNMGGTCHTFLATVGVDDEVGANGRVSFEVVGDAVKLYDSGPLTSSSAPVNVSVDVTGRAQLRLVVTDGGNGNSSDHADWANARIICGGTTPPAVTIGSPAPTLTYKVGDTISYAGSATDGSGKPIPSANLSWQITINHCPQGVCHTHPFLTSTGSSSSFVVPDHGDNSYFELSLTATDSAGVSTTKSVSIQPQTVQLTLATIPVGLNLVYGGTVYQAPATITTIVGSSHTVQAPSPQGPSVFSSWSDGGPQQHNITMAAANTTLTATFTQPSQQLSVTATSPANNASEAAINAPVTATFSIAIDPATLNTTTFTLRPSASTTPLAATVSYAPGTLTGTLTPAASLQNATSYTATIKSGPSGVRTTSGGMLSSDYFWTFTTAAAPTNSAPFYISDLTWASSTNGWGPVERDQSNGEHFGGDGRPLAIRGTTFAKGLGVHAASDIRVPIPSGCTTFAAKVGIDDEVAPQGSVVFQVWADGVKLYESSTVTAAMAAQDISVSISGRSQLQLIVTDGGNGAAYDHADWADAQMSCGLARPPVGVSFLSDLTWTSAVNGYGPVEKDMSSGDIAAGDGNPLRIRGVTYSKGIGAHAASDLRYALGRACTSFSAVVGVDDEATPGSVVFQVWSDGVKLYDSGVVTGSSAARPVSVDLTGRLQLQLVITDGGDGIGWDHGDWADAKITCP